MRTLGSLLDEDAVLRAARIRGEDVGCASVEPEEGAALRFLAAAARARTVVEVGTGVGVSGLWLLRGMSPDGVLTSIDLEPEYQRCARAAFREAGYPPSRLRLINGHALDVLPRLADGGYDLVFVDAMFVEYPRYLVEALRLLRPGGVVALSGARPDPELLDRGRAPDHDAVREVQRMCGELADEGELTFWPAPLECGLLVAARSA